MTRPAHPGRCSIAINKPLHVLLHVWCGDLLLHRAWSNGLPHGLLLGMWCQLRAGVSYILVAGGRHAGGPMSVFGIGEQAMLLCVCGGMMDWTLDNLIRCCWTIGQLDQVLRNWIRVCLATTRSVSYMSYLYMQLDMWLCGHAALTSHLYKFVTNTPVEFVPGM